MKKLNLRNALQLSIELDDFNGIDFEKEYKTLKPGDLVKVCKDRNFLWVYIEEIINFQYIIGKLNIGLNLFSDINNEDIIEFSFENIYDIIKVNQINENEELSKFIYDETFGKGILNICICGKCNNPIYINAYNKFIENETSKNKN